MSDTNHREMASENCVTSPEFTKGTSIKYTFKKLELRPTLIVLRCSHEIASPTRGPPAWAIGQRPPPLLPDFPISYILT